MRKCWCKDLVYICSDCEGKEKWKKLNYIERSLVIAMQGMMKQEKGKGSLHEYQKLSGELDKRNVEWSDYPIYK